MPFTGSASLRPPDSMAAADRWIRVRLLSRSLEIQFSQPKLVHSFRIFDEEHEQALDASDRLDALNKLVGGSFPD